MNALRVSDFYEMIHSLQGPLCYYPALFKLIRNRIFHSDVLLKCYSVITNSNVFPTKKNRALNRFNMCFVLRFSKPTSQAYKYNIAKRYSI